MHSRTREPLSPKRISRKPSSSDPGGWRRLRRVVCAGLSLAIAYAAPVRCGPADPAVMLPRPRIIISSDFPPLDVIAGTLGTGPLEKRSDPDDVQSMVRFLVYANEFHVEGLIASSATLANIAGKRNILNILDLYEKVEANLRLHDPRYPTSAELRKVTAQGLSGSYGKPATAILGPDKNTEASHLVIRVVDGPGEGPVWFCEWGGSRELAQALWKVRRDRSQAQTAA